MPGRSREEARRSKIYKLQMQGKLPIAPQESPKEEEKKESKPKKKEKKKEDKEE